VSGEKDVRVAEGFGVSTSVLPHAAHYGTSVARYATQACAVVEVRYPPGHQSPRHAHESPFIHTVLGGYAMQKVPEKSVRESGDVCFYPAGRDHAHSVLNDGWHALAIDILPTCAATFAESGADFSRPFVVTDQELFRSVVRLQREIRYPDPLSRLQVDGLVMDVCVQVLRLSHKGSTSAPRWLRRARLIIDERFAEDLSLDMLAGEAGVHPFHLSRAFRRWYGETVGDYVRRRRVNEARRLLEASSDSLTQIAVAIGYHDESHLSKAFKNVVGTTPGRYRQAVRSAPSCFVMPASEIISI
jgi:AraC family transcriptional regulator